MTIASSSRRPPRSWLLVVPCVLLNGCGGSRSETFDRFVPDQESARAAVTAALDAWKQGQPPGRITTVTPAVEVVDSSRRPQRPLRDFEVLGAVGVDVTRSLAARLILDDPAEEQVVRFVVVGREPLWVFRQEDYDQIAHWEHAMERPAAPADADDPATPRLDVP